MSVPPALDVHGWSPLAHNGADRADRAATVTHAHAEAAMMRVFFGGSRRLSRLDYQVKGRLDEIIRKQLPVIIGDANGADKAVQDYFHQHAYRQVEVFCTEGRCRNNA